MFRRATSKKNKYFPQREAQEIEIYLFCVGTCVSLLFLRNQENSTLTSKIGLCGLATRELRQNAAEGLLISKNQIYRKKQFVA